MQVFRSRDVFGILYSISIVDFEQANVCWVLTKQYGNIQIIFHIFSSIFHCRKWSDRIIKSRIKTVMKPCILTMNCLLI